MLKVGIYTEQNCTISDCGDYGIYSAYGNTIESITSCTISGCKYGIRNNYGNVGSITNCNIEKNKEYGLSGSDSKIQIDAQNCWWGSTDGPGGIAPGSGDKIWGNINYEPWAKARIKDAGAKAVGGIGL